MENVTSSFEKYRRFPYFWFIPLRQLFAILCGFLEKLGENVTRFQPLGILKTTLAAYPREALFFIAASFVNAMGSAFMWPLTTLYVYNELHRSMTDAGFVLMLQSLAGIGGQFIGGTLFHRLGAKAMIVSSLTLASVAQLLILFTSSWSIYLAIMAMLGLLNNISMPAIQAFIGFRWKEKRRELFNVVYVSNNLGMAIGTSLGGLLAAYSFSFTFLFNSISTFGFALFFFLFMRKMTAALKADVVVDNGMYATEQGAFTLLKQYPIYLFIGMGSACIWFSMALWGAGIAPFISDQGMNLSAYSLLWTVNGIVIFAGQPITSLLKRTVTRSLSAQLVGSGVCYGIGFGFILFYHHSYYMLVLGMIVSTLGEMLLSPTVPTFITEKTGINAPFYLGVVGSFSSVGRLLGPLVLGKSFDSGGVTPVLLIGTIMSFVAIALFLMHASLHRTKQQAKVDVM